MLLTEVWGPAYDDDAQVLRVHIANLRRKIEPDRRARATSPPTPASATASGLAAFTKSLCRRRRRFMRPSRARVLALGCHGLRSDLCGRHRAGLLRRDVPA